MRLTRVLLGLALIGIGGFFLYGWIQAQLPSAVSAIVIPHHDMVAETRAAFLDEVKEDVQPKTIIVISPDHFDQNNAPVVTTDRVWSTQYGELAPDRELITVSGVPIQDEPFTWEHGVTSIVGPLREAFPKAKIFPLLAHRGATYREIVALTTRLAQHCDGECLLVASIDFSHSAAQAVAELHDEVSLRALYNLDSVLGYKKAEVDSPEAMVALIVWATLHDTSAFRLFAHTNSGTLTGNEIGEMTTHIMGSYQRGAKEERRSYSFMIGGDTMFARAASLGDEQFKDLGERFFWGVDDAFLNLEGVMTTSTEPKWSDWNSLPPRFLFDARHLTTLDRARVTGMFVTNNHARDGKEEGYRTTQELLRRVGIEFGAPSSTYPYPGVGIVTRDDSAIPVAYVAFDTLAGIPDFEGVLSSLRDTYRIVVYVHWGREYETHHNATQEAIAHALVDLGADLVVGSHPHVLQDVEVYNGVPIFYSLGNFLFDQDMATSTSQGLVVGGVFSEKGLTVYPIPVESDTTPRALSTNEIVVWQENVTTPLAPFYESGQRYFFPKNAPN